MDGVFTAIIAGGTALAVFGFIAIDQLLLLFTAGAVGKIVGKIP